MVFTFRKVPESEEEILGEIRELQNKFFLNSQWSKNFFNFFFKHKERLPSFIIAEKGEELAGFILGKIEKNNQDVFVVHKVLVLPRFRGKDLSTSLMREMIEDVRRNTKAKKIKLSFRELNKLGSFYKKLGFSFSGKVGEYKNGEVKCEMELSL